VNQGLGRAPSEPSSPTGPSDSFRRQLEIAALGLLVLVLGIYLLRTFDLMLQQLLIAVFLFYLILPVRNWLAGYRLSLIITYTIITVGILVIGWGLALMVQLSLADLTSKWPAYEKNLDAAIEATAVWLPGLEADKLKKAVVGHMPTEQESVTMIRSVLVTFLDVTGQMVLVLVYLIFILAEEVTLRSRLRRSFEERQATDIMVVLHRINLSISKYISVKTIVSILMGVLTTLTLMVFGVDYAVPWGFLAFLLNYIPYLGAVVAVFLPSALAMVQFGDVGLGLLILFILNLIHTVLGYWLEPVMAGERLNLSPFVIILSLAFWYSVWGVVGMIMAVPLMVSLKIVLENIPATRPLAVMLSNVPRDEAG
jgi:predicted PurR-regulated permease PerM